MDVPEPHYHAKFVFIVGGVMSGIGKGIVTVSAGRNFIERGFQVNVCKIDPYLNIDAGTMNPFEHGEVFVTDDGGELDVDFGHYTRFLQIDVKKTQNITTGQVYFEVISRERKGEYLGGTVQVIPHITDEIKRRIHAIDQETQADVLLIEIGGTVGDIESQPFLEAVRQIMRERPANETMLIMATYVPFPPHVNEPKTKPTQHAVRDLKAAGLNPSIIVARAEREIGQKAIEKIALFSGLNANAVFSLPDLSDVLEGPMFLDQQGFGGKLLEIFQETPRQEPTWESTINLLNLIKNQADNVVIGLTGKYTQLKDAYISVFEALKHAGMHEGAKVEVVYIDVEEFEKDTNAITKLQEVDGVLLPGGFGKRGVEGKIKVIEYCREHSIPFLGICLGFQLASVEFARNVCGLSDAHSTEMNPDTRYPIVDLQPTQRGIDKLGGTMRLGAHDIEVFPNTLLWELYGQKTKIRERHRHRYELNPAYTPILQDHGLVLSAKSEFYEALELPDHPFFLAVQFHPEFKSTPWNPSPPYQGLVRSALKLKRKKQERERAEVNATAE